MADEFDDVEDMLEAPFRKDMGSEGNNVSPERDHRKRRSKHGHRHRHSRSRSSSRSPRRHRRSGSRGRRRKSRSGDRYRSRSRDRQRRSRGRYRGSRSGDQHRRSMSPQRSPGKRFRGEPPFRRERSPEPEPPSEERDKRTVMCMQLAALVGPVELQEFFQKVGQVKEVKMIADKNSRRSKGIAYVEFHDEGSIPAALALSNQKLYGVPIIVQPTMAEKNRLAALAQNLMKKEVPRNLYVGSLHYDINNSMLEKIFEPFGDIEKLEIQKDNLGKSKGYAFILFKECGAAERAKDNMDGFELAGRPIKVKDVTEGSQMNSNAMEMLDSENYAVGVGMTQQGRAQLMAKLAVGHHTDLVVPSVPSMLAAPLGLPQMAGTMSMPSSCLLLTNMFDMMANKEPGWEDDIRDDVLEELMAFGDVVHVHVDPISPGHVYVKTANSQVSSSAINSLDGRFFAGKKISAQRIPELSYHMKFPESIAAVVPIKPLS